MFNGRREPFSLTTILVVFAIAASATTGILSTFSSLTEVSPSPPGITRESLQELDNRTRALQNQLESLKRSVVALDVPQTPADIRRMKGLVKEIDQRLARIEGAIISSPTRALEVPLMQRDIESIKASQQTSLATLKDSVDRVYDLNKWLLGTMAVSVIFLALATLLKGKEATKA